MKIRHPKYIAGGRIDCEIDHPQHGWIPFTADPNDVEPLGAQVFEAVKDTAAAYIPPPAPSPEEIAEQQRAEAQANRQAAFEREADPLFLKYQRGEATEQEWLDKIEEIRARYPYPEE